MKGHVRVSRAGESKHWASVVQDQPAALSLWPTVPEVAQEVSLVISRRGSGLQVLWRDVNGVRAG